MSDAHQPPFEYSGATVNPGVPDGTMIAEISRLAPGPPWPPVIASTVTSDVIEVPELVIKAFDPSMTHCPSSSRAVVRMPPAMSEPPPGSVSPNAASRSPWHSSGSQRARCSGLPNR